MTGVIANAKALDPDHVPETLQAREGELDQLRVALQPILHGQPGSNVCIFGPSGAGKTTIARYGLRRLEEEVLDVNTGYVSAMCDSSRRDLLYQLLRHCGYGLDLQREGTSASTVLDRFRELDEPTIAVVDEVSHLRDPTTLVALHEVPDLSVIAITLDEDRWFSEVESAVVSRFRSAIRITLDPYGPDQLREILSYRADVGLEAGILADGALDAIVTRSDGNARLAIGLLYQAATVVQSGVADRITPDVVQGVEGEAREAIRQRYRDQLDTHQRLLYEIVAEAGEIRAEELHERFLERSASEGLPAKRTRVRYLEAMREYGMIEKVGRGRGTSYHIR